MKRLRKGFTTIEVLLVIVLLGLIATTVIPNIAGLFRVGVKSSVRRFAALVKYSYDQSILTGRIHRIVLDMDKQSWKVEAAEAGQLPIDSQKFGLLPEGMRESDRVTTEPTFKVAGENLFDKMPNGVKIVQVQSWRLGKDAVAKKGSVSIYSYPSGFIDEVTVVLAEEGKEESQQFLVTTKSLTGRIKVHTENKAP
ncbi:MAG: prepilin-type N-terminal cleavage/methylation domain-containing protein [Bdellovibrionota bacterium]